MPSAEQEQYRRRFNEARSFNENDDDEFFPGPPSTAPPPPPSSSPAAQQQQQPQQQALNPAARPFVPPARLNQLSMPGLRGPVDEFRLRTNMAVLGLPTPSRISIWREGNGTWTVVALYSRQEHAQLATASMQSGWLLGWMHLWEHWGLA